MRRLILGLPLLFALVLAIPLYWGLDNDPTELPSVLLGNPLPGFELPDLQQPAQLRTFKDMPAGTPYLVNVWATWCAACKIEHPMLNKIAQSGYKIVGLNYKDDLQSARNWLIDRGDPYEFVLFDEVGVLVIDLGVYGAPETFVVDAAGKIQYRHIGIVDETVWTKELKPRMDVLSTTTLAPQMATQEVKVHDDE